MVASVLLLAVDSWGGVAMMLSLAEALRDEGVSSRVAAYSDFGDKVRAAGCDFVDLELSTADWGRLAELGVGASPVPYRKLSPARLANAIKQMTDNPEIAARAKQLSTVLSSETGPATAVRAIMAALSR